MIQLNFTAIIGFFLMISTTEIMAGPEMVLLTNKNKKSIEVTIIDTTIDLIKAKRKDNSAEISIRKDTLNDESLDKIAYWEATQPIVEKRLQLDFAEEDAVVLFKLPKGPIAVEKPNVNSASANIKVSFDGIVKKNTNHTIGNRTSSFMIEVYQKNVSIEEEKDRLIKKWDSGGEETPIEQSKRLDRAKRRKTEIIRENLFEAICASSNQEQNPNILESQFWIVHTKNLRIIFYCRFDTTSTYDYPINQSNFSRIVRSVREETPKGIKKSD